MATITNRVTWVDNTEELRAHLAKGLDTIVATQAGADKMAKSLGGEGLLKAAHNFAAAVEQMGGVEKLTNAERERGNALLDKALQKYEALGKVAPTALQDLFAATKQQTGAWEDFIGKFDPKQAIADPLTAAKGAADAFTGALGPMGTAAAAIVTTVGAAAGVLFKFADGAAHVGGELNDLSEITGIAVPKLSGLKFAADVAGTSMDTIASAIFKLEQNIGKGGPEVERGFQRIGLSIAEISHLSPDEQFLKIASAINRISDPAQRAAAAVELFGKQGRELLPLLSKDIEGLTEKAQELGFIWTTQDAAGAEAFKMKSNELRLSLGNLTTLIGKELIPLLNTALDVTNWTVAKFLIAPIGMETERWERDIAFLKVLKQALEEQLQLRGLLAQPLPSAPGAPSVGTGAEDMKAATDAIAAQGLALEHLSGDLQKAHAATIPLTEEQQRLALSLDTGVLSLKEIAHDVGVSEGAIKAFFEANKKAAEAAKQHAAELRKLAEEFERLLSSIEHHDKATVMTQALDAALHSIGQKTHDLLPLSAAVETLLSSIEHHDAATVKTESLAEALGHLGQRTNDIEQLKEKLKGLNTFVVGIEPWRASFDEMTDSLDGMVRIISRLAQISGPAFGGILQEIGRIISSLAVAKHAMDSYAESTTRAGKALSLLEAGTAVMGATGGGPDKTASNIVGGATTGAEIGTMIAPGIGTVIGAIGGAVVGWLRSMGVGEVEKAGRAIEASFEKGFGGGFAKMQQSIVAGYLATGKTAAEANRDIEAMFAAEKQGGEATAEAIKKITDQLDLQAKAAQALPQLLTDLSGGLNKITPLADTLTAGDQEKFDRFGRLVMSTVETMRAAGKSEGEIFEAIGPSLDKLAAAQAKFGFASSGTLQELLKFRQFDKDNQALSASIDGVVEMLKAERMMGRLTQQDWDDLTATTNDFIDAAMAAGLSQDEAMRRAQPALQQEWELWKEGKVAVDDKTAATLQAAEADGLVGEQFKSIGQQTLDILKAIAIALGAELPGAAKAGADGIKTALTGAVPTTAELGIDDLQNQLGNGISDAAKKGWFGSNPPFVKIDDKLGELDENAQDGIVTTLADDLPSAAEEGADGVWRAIQRIPTSIDIDVNFHTNNLPTPPTSGGSGEGDTGNVGGAFAGGFVDSFGLSSFMDQRFVGSRPTGPDTELIWTMPGEVLLNPLQQQGLLQMLQAGQTLAQAQSSRGPSSPAAAAGATVVNVTIQAVDAKSFEDLTRKNPRAITEPMLTAIRRNYRRTDSILADLVKR